MTVLGYRQALFAMAGGLFLVLAGASLSLPRELGKSKSKAKFKGLPSKTREVNVLSGARFFLFGARDIWFVVGVPVFLSVNLGLELHRGRDLPRALDSNRVRFHPVDGPR